MIKLKYLLLLFLISSFLGNLSGQTDFNFSKKKYSIKPTKISNDIEKRKCQSAIIIWENTLSRNNNGKYKLSFITPVGFTCFGAGIDILRNDIKCIDLQIEYRLKKTDNTKWSEWYSADFETSPPENNPNLYWSDLMFTPDADTYNEIEILISVPENLNINKLRIDVMNIVNSADYGLIEKGAKLNGCPALPYVIPRSVWLEPWYGTQSYTPTTIYPTHVVMHHGASPDTYTDGAAVVRSYWNYHVNSLGWSDIGYNYLIDKYGNIYQGRKNDDIEGRDVRGAHAGASNNESIGVNFLGNADVTTPTTPQLNKLYEFLGWWFDTRGYDPTTSAPITLQSGGTEVRNRICGHKDVNVGGTACPGIVMYSLLPTMQTETKAVIDACLTTPVTYVNVSGNWQTNDFVSNFLDTADAGLDIAFYQILDFDGIEWRANSDYGFFNDNFDNAIHPNWTNTSGNWSINNTYLNQTNEDSSNTNLHIPVVQTSGNIYMYHFGMNIGGIGTNKRAGFHFFCDDPTMTQRNNSYMVYFRVDQNECQIYKAENDNITLYTNDYCNVDIDTWYDYKIILNTNTGEIKAYQNDFLVSSWTDPAPFTTGNSISLRTGNCNVLYNDFKIYKNRTNSETVTIGASNEIRYENTNPGTPSCRIKSIIIDSNNKWSSLEGVNANIDWTPPSIVAVNDGISADIDTTYNNTQLSANWTSSADPNSDIVAYWYCIGDTPGSNNIIDWTNNGLNTIITRTGLSLNYNDTYYFTVKSINGAELYSIPDTSNGQLLLENYTNAPVASFYAFDTLLVMPNSSAIFINTSVGANSYLWNFGDGTTSTDQNPWHVYDTVGYYTVSLIAQSITQSDDTLILNNYIHVVNSTDININDASNNICNIFPNPFSENINIEFYKNIKDVRIEICDIYGRKLFETKFENVNNREIISLKNFFNNLSNGTYLIKIVADSNVSTKLVQKIGKNQ